MAAKAPGKLQQHSRLEAYATFPPRSRCLRRPRAKPKYPGQLHIWELAGVFVHPLFAQAKSATLPCRT
ncbi:hypothetical protein DVH26_03950 [Paenibacillus sp. H1-7]|nr:hypothetical protein DVH26_03950 [Paenibacillus sp. H1-7]